MNLRFILHFSMEHIDNAELFGGDSEYDNYYENGGWYQDEYGEWYQDPNYQSNFSGKENGQLNINGPSLGGSGAETSTNKTQATINNHNSVIVSGTTSANNKTMQNATTLPSKHNAR